MQNRGEGAAVGMRKYLKIIIPLFSLALIATGVWMIYPPAAFITVGMLLWIDMSIDHLIFGLKRK